MSTAKSLARSIIDPIATTPQDTTTENILHIRKLISRELEEMNLVFSDVCNAMKSKFSLTHENDIEFIHSRIDSIGELAENLAQEYEARLLSHPNCGVSTQLESMKHAQASTHDMDTGAVA